MNSDTPYVPDSIFRPNAASFASHAQAKPIIRMVNKLLKSRLPTVRKKGFTTGDVQIKHKKVKYW